MGSKSYNNILLDNFSFTYPLDTPHLKNIVSPKNDKFPTSDSVEKMEKFIDEKYNNIQSNNMAKNNISQAIPTVNNYNQLYNQLITSLENQIESLKSEVYFLREENEKFFNKSFYIYNVNKSM